ncbi:hypothetical protein GGF31_008431 [Allomyces arbusculus]|nr:hypothetical protein GGF31_008431 [Allomyces arbusculus]
MAKTDARVEKTQEVVQGIRAIKYFAWERPFAAQLHDLRDQELHASRRYWLVMSATHVLYHASEILVIFFTFVLFTGVAGHELGATTVFTVIAHFNTPRRPMSALPDLAIQFLETRVSVRHVGAYLDGVDIVNYMIDASGNVNINVGGHDHALLFIGAASVTLSWSSMLAVDPPASFVSAATGATKDDAAILLSTFNSMCAPAASTCEKTDLTDDDPPTQRFQLKDINFSAPRGKLTLLNATAKENVLFGAANKDRGRYVRIIKARALERDFAVLEAGDNTQVGEKGVTLLGGQKSRLSLACACYMDTDVVLLDVVLSAVDAPTAAHLLMHCIFGDLVGRTRILVTHNVGLVAPWSDHLILLRDGRVVAEADSLAKLTDQDSAAGFGNYMNQLADLPTSTTPTCAPSAASLDFMAVPNAAPKSVMQDGDVDARPAVVAHRLVQDEERPEGSVSWSVYAAYLRQSGGAFWWTMLLGIMLMIPQLLDVGQQWWLETWTPSYAWLATDIVTNNVIQGAFNTLGARISWFYSTPVGRILNRISADIYTIDHDIIATVTFTAAAAPGAGARARAPLKGGHSRRVDGNIFNDLDAKIQQTVRGADLAEATILCIAHRLPNPDGLFSHMRRESGEFEYLSTLATREWVEKTQEGSTDVAA